MLCKTKRIKESGYYYFVLVLKRARIIYEIFAFSLTRTVYLESLAIFARDADYIYIESIIPAVQSTTCFICHFCTATAACHLFHYSPTLAAAILPI